LHIDELHDLYSSSDIIRGTESRRMGGGGGQSISQTLKISKWDGPKKRDRYESPVVYEDISKMNLKNEGRKVWRKFFWLR
jgi:hypothetical protein